MIDRPNTTAQAGALLRELVALPLAEAIALAAQTDAETFLPPVEVTLAEDAWWQLCDAAFGRYRSAASLPGERNVLVIERALTARHRAGDVTDLDATLDAAQAALCPRWPSGIAALDKAAGEGAYGVEVIAGEPGAGKSLLALDQALQAASTGWRVCYFDTELSIPNLRSRLNALARCRSGDYQRALGTRRRLHFAGLDTIRDGFGALCGHIVERIDVTDAKVLIVIDHIHDVARGMARGSTSSVAFFRALEDIADAAKSSRRESEGAVAWILVAELNRSGGIRGGQLDYAADLVLSLEKDADTSNITKIRVPKGREGGDGPYGKFVVDARHGRLVPCEERLEAPPGPEASSVTEPGWWEM